MNTNLSLTLGVHEEEKLLCEIGNSEKQLWALIHSKGLLHSDAQDLYRKVRSIYERIILNSHTHSELQDVEYSLWKLHYKYIDEFRKIIQKSSGNVESRKSGAPQNGVVQRNNANHFKLFKSFLSQAIEFYQKLIVKLREYYGVSGEALFHKKATYIGDDFLALYHCVRSLAVKEPFPDAWNNLIMLFEKNRLSQLQCVAREVCFDFLKPSGRIVEATEAQPKHISSNGNKIERKSTHFTDTKLWSPIVRSISFFFITSSLEEFPIALTCTIEELDKVLELDDFRPCWSQDKNDKLQLSLSAAFTFMGRFVERCLNSSSLNYCLLLPSVLIFMEWCSRMLDAIEVCATNQKSRRAISYFFDVFVELLNQLNNNRKGTEKLLDNTPLWEDYEDNFESGIELRTERIREAAIKIAGRSSNLSKWIITCDDVSGIKFYAASSEENHVKNETERSEFDENSTKRE
ncbi:unnamed protein product [Lupinus luteus]|uniref:Uncharacterized protein n=1 Tax=Lupinus luteus TaxID=3873 RepID=A0AAV1VVP1_LUPLU